MLKKKLMLVCSSFLVMGVLFTGCASTSTKESTQKVVQSTFKEVTVTKGEIKEALSLSGSLITKDKDTLTAGTNSTVVEIYVAQNKKVVKGDDLILLENGTVVEAPYDGMITKVNVKVGDTVTPQSELINIVDNSDYYINATIDESDIGKVKLNQEVRVKVTALNKEYKGKISYISSEATVSGDRAKFDITVDIDGDFTGLYYGLSVEAEVILNSAKEALIIPIEAVSVKGEEKTVSMKKGETFVEQEVTLGAQDSSYVQILTGLKENDVIKVETAQRTQNPNNFGGMRTDWNRQNAGMPGGMMPPGEQGQRARQR